MNLYENFAGERNCAIEINELQARLSNKFITLHYHCDVIERRKAGVSLDVYSFLRVSHGAVFFTNKYIMKTFIVCFPNGQAIRVNGVWGTPITRIAEDYPTANVYWLDAPENCSLAERRIVKYEPL